MPSTIECLNAQAQLAQVADADLKDRLMVTEERKFEKILMFLAERGPRGTRDVAQVLDIEISEARALLKFLCDNGAVVKSGAKRGVKYDLSLLE